MGKYNKEESVSSNPSGLTSFQNIYNEVSLLLKQLHAKENLGDSPKQRNALTKEVGKLVNEMLDSIE